MAASTNSGLNTIRFNGADYAPTASFTLFQKAIEIAKEKNISVKAGGILSSDEFYADDFENYKKWADYGVLCVEMETSALYTIAARFQVKALSLLTISDSLVTHETTTSEERAQTFTEMIEIALAIS